MAASGIITATTTSTLAEGAHVYPAFYACYMLRSYFKDAISRRTYIGSTPDPPRRIRQHNGEIKGGALRTRMYRPWEMDIICYNFPSKLVALQFEWAWNKPSASRHLRLAREEGERPLPRFPKSLGTGPETRIQVLQAMLTSAPWSRYPLRVMIFSAEALDIWNRCQRGEVYKKSSKRWDSKSINRAVVLHKDPVVVRLEGVDGNRAERANLTSREPSGPIAVDDGDAIIDDYERMDKRLALTSNPTCCICHGVVDVKSPNSFTLCSSSTDCFSVSHFACLATHFLSRDPGHVIPDKGTCPECRSPLRWGDIVKGAFRRMPVKAKRSKATSAVSATDDDTDTEQEGQESVGPRLKAKATPTKSAKATSRRLASRVSPLRNRKADGTTLSATSGKAKKKAFSTVSSAGGRSAHLGSIIRTNAPTSHNVDGDVSTVEAMMSSMQLDA